jgi:hypothetical protein
VREDFDMNKMEIFEVVAEVLKESHGYDASVRDDYSGRGMYGEKVPAIVTDAPSVLVGATFATVMLNDYEAQEYEVLEVTPMRVDSMGKSAMVYY